MASITVNFEFPKPYREADPLEHVDEALDKVATSLDMIDALLKTHMDALAGKAASNHVHTIANVTGLQGALDGKMAAGATFTLAGLTDVSGADAAPDGYVLIKSGGFWIPASAAAAIGAHGHTIAEVTGLAAALTAHDTAIAGLDSGAGISDKAVFRNAIGLSYADAAAQLAFRNAIGIPSPTGCVAYTTGNAALPGTVKANGAALSRTTYAALWAFAQASGNLAASQGAKTAGQYGPGDGATTFTLPDLRGEFLRVWDDGRGIDSGRGVGSWQDDRFEDHYHSGGIVASAGGVAGGNGGSWVSGFSNTGNTASGGAGSETRPRNIAYLACIYY